MTQETKVEEVTVTKTPTVEPSELEILNDKYLRAMAELENNRRRAEIDLATAARNRAMSVAANFLPVSDAIDAALKHSPDDAGIIAMSRAMSAAFDSIGIKKIKSVGEILNPQFHNAVSVIETPDAKPNTIMEEFQSGYLFGDAVLRPAMVVVAK